MRLAVCWKHVVAGGPDDGSSASDSADTRWAAVSPADEAALEIALTIRDRVADSTVTVVALGPPAAEAALRRALAAGADRAVRIAASTALDGSHVARSLADAVDDADQVWCGDYSVDRGTGSVPAFIAAHIGAAQALGLVGVESDGARPGAPLRVVRRLDGGRRELLDVATPAVFSVEGSVASLRRAGVAASLVAKAAPVDVRPGPQHDPELTHGHVTPYRPRARVLPPPVGDTLDRVRGILDVGGGDPGHAETVTLEPSEAARCIVDQLVEWGYLDPIAG